MASYPEWTFTLSEYGTGKKIGEVLDASDRQIIRALSGPSTATFKVQVTNRLVSDLYTQELNLLCYRDGQLLFHGPVISAQLAGEDPTATPTVVVTATDPSWYFDRRITGRAVLGTDYAGGTDRLTAAESAISTENTYGETGVKTLGLTCGTTLTGVYKAGPYKKLSEVIAELGNTLNGFDWRIDPIEYNPTGSKIGEFRAAAILGNNLPGIVFEYQGKGNARSPNFIRSKETTVNEAYSVPDGGPADAGGVLTASDTGSINKRGRLQEVVDTSGLVNVGLRQAVVNDHILYRKEPRQVLSFSPDMDDGTGRTPRPFVEYTIGDYVRARVLYNDVVLVDGTVRIYKLQVDVDENQKETITPTVVSEA